MPVRNNPPTPDPLNGQMDPFLGPLVPELNVFNLPYLFRDAAHMEAVIDGPIGDELLQKLTDHPTAGLVGLCWMNAGTRNVYNSQHPIRSAEDLKGLKIRMMGNPIFVDTMNAMGGNGVSMGFDQLINEELSAEDQDLIMRLAKEAQQRQRQLWYAEEEKALADMKAHGVEVVEVDDKEALREAVKPVWDKYGAQLGDLVERIQAVQ